MKTMIRPRVKPEHAPFRISGGRIRLGGVSLGIAGEVDDPTGSVWTLLANMDGTRDIDEIVGQVLSRHPEEREENVRHAISVFIESGYIEDAGSPDPDGLSAHEKERYSRSRMYFRWVDMVPRSSTWEPQLALSRAHVTVAGLGGTGGVAALALVASGVGHLHCVDYDSVELSNLNRQVLFSEDDIGVPKVTAALRRLRQLNSNVEITGQHLQINEAADILPLARGCDVLLLAADRPPETRVWANRACLDAKTPWVDAGYHGPLVTVGTYVPGDNGCWECVRFAHDEKLTRELGPNFEDAEPRKPAVANAVNATSAGMSGILAGQAVISLLTGVPPVTAGQVQTINLVNLNAPFVVSSPRRRDCPGCGGTG
jgi:molybdopterin-synthase adenylyltransferase